MWYIFTGCLLAFILMMWGLIEWGAPFYVFVCLLEFILEACDD